MWRLRGGRARRSVVNSSSFRVGKIRVFCDPDAEILRDKSGQRMERSLEPRAALGTFFCPLEASGTLNLGIAQPLFSSGFPKQNKLPLNSVLVPAFPLDKYHHPTVVAVVRDAL